MFLTNTETGSSWENILCRSHFVSPSGGHGKHHDPGRGEGAHSCGPHGQGMGLTNPKRMEKYLEGSSVLHMTLIPFCVYI